MSATPFGTVLQGPAAVWTGKSWVVVGILCRVGARPCDGALAAAAYDPGTDTWTSIDANPQPAAGTGRGHGPIVGRGVGMLGSSAVVRVGRPVLRVPARFVGLGLAPGTPAVRWSRVLGRRRHRRCPTVKTSTVFGARARGAGVGRVGHRFRDPGSPTPGTVCTDSSVVVLAPDLSSVAAFDVARAAMGEIAPPPLPVTGPLVGGFTGKSALFWRPEEAVAYDLANRHLAVGPARSHRGTPDRVSWTQSGAGLSISDDGRTRSPAVQLGS